MKPSRLYPWRLRAALTVIVTGVLALFASINANAQIQWIDADVGGPTFKGSSVKNGDGTYTIQGGGSDIWNASSQFHYLYAWASGTSWEITAQFQAFSGPDQWSKVELLASVSDPTAGPQGGDPFIAMMDTQPSTVTPPDGTAVGVNNGGIDQFRTAANGNADWLQAGATPAPAYPNDWFKIQRQGSVFNLYKSSDGVNWHLYINIDTAQKQVIGQDNNTSFGTAWPNLVAVGIAVTAHNDTWVDPNTSVAGGATAVIANLSATFPAATAPTLLATSQQVKSGVTNVLGGEATLSFVATNNAAPISGAFPIAYQWYRNGSVVTNATNSLHTWLLDYSDNAAQYKCTASLLAPYNAITVNSATAAIGVLPGVFKTNGLKIEMFTGAASRTVVEVGNIGPATWVGVEPNCDDPGGYGNYYATRVSGWFIPPTTDNYTFYVATDDDSDLFLSTDKTIGNKRLIAQETVWMNIDQWLAGGTGTGSWSQNNSDTWADPFGNSPWQAGIQLNAGQPYYIENVHYQGTGGDCFSVTYQTATMKADPNWFTTFTNGTPSLLYGTSNTLMYATIPATTLTWVSQPTNTSTAIGFPAIFYSQAASDAELAVKYQWYKGTPGVAIAGSTTANLTTANTVAGDDGAKFYVVATTAENELSITSAVASVQVFQAALEKGWALNEYWYNANPGIAPFRTTNVINGVATACLTNYTGAGGPDHTIFQPRLEGNSHAQAGANFTDRVSAFFTPATTANYVFFVNSDDNSDLYVSTDNTPGNARLVAQETAWGNAWQWQGDIGAAAANAQKCSATWVDNVTASGNSPWLSGIPLTAGQTYYVAIIHNEGGEGDNVEATFMTMDEYTASQNLGPVNGQYSRFTGNLIASYAPKSFTMTFAQQPGTVTVPLGGNATFTAVGVSDSKTPVGDNGDPRNEWNNFVLYQWTKNGVPIPGASSSSYVFGPVSPLDSTIQFACTARGMGYVDSSGNPLWATSSIASVVVSGTPVYEPGFSFHRYWSLNPRRVNVENHLGGDPTWTMASPAFAVDDTGTEIADNFTDDLVGFFIPPTSGNYVFFCNSDDDADLFLSTDSSASSRRIIAQELASAGALNWGVSSTAADSPQTRSDTFVDPNTSTTLYSNGIPLIAGQKYFMQMVHHQGGGGTESCATYIKVGDPTPASGTPSAIRLSQLGSYVPKCTYVTFTTQPQSIAVNNYVSTTITAGGMTDSTVPIGGEGDWRPFFTNYLQFQWYKNGTAVAGATSSALAIPEVMPSDNNAQIFCTMRALGYGDNAGNAMWATSQVAIVKVTLTAPQLTYAANYLNTNYLVFGYPATNYITIGFSQPMDPVGLKNPANYTLPAGVTLLGIMVNSNSYRSVALAISGTLTLPVNISVNASLASLGGGLPITGTLTTAIKSVPLTDGDIGAIPGQDPAWPGMMYVTGTNAYTIACEGSDIWGTDDGFNFAFEKKTGDFDVVVRQKDITHTSNWAKGGLMVREDLSSGSRNWNIINDPLASDGIAAPDGSGYGASMIECNCRYTNDVSGMNTTAGWVGEIARTDAPAYPNAWVRIARKGSVLTAYSSSDGLNWKARATNDTAVVGTGVALPATVYVGLCTTAHNNDPVGSTEAQLKYLNTVDYDGYNSSYVYVPVTTGPTMTFTKSGSNIIIGWAPTGGTLLESTKVGAGAVWTTVGTANPATVPITGAAQFFRVQE
jgi:hypothetical protein